MGKVLVWIVVLLICFSSLTNTLISGFSSRSYLNISDTTIQGVLIENNYSPGIFPESWREAPISAEGENMSELEIKRTKIILAKALAKYPQTVLQENLHSIYLLRSMKFYNLGYGGTNSTDALYLTNDGIINGYTDRYLEQTFHHEFSSILYRNYPELLDTIAWKNANLKQFEYSDPENGVGAIRSNQSSQVLNKTLCEKGFLTQYAQSSLENDLNTIGQNLFLPAKGFWEIVDRYPRIKAKVRLLIKFYRSIDPLFTESYFRKIK